MKFNSFCNDTKIWNGPSELPIYNKSVSIGQVLLYTLNKNPTKIGQISANSGIKMTNKEIHLKTIQVAENLKRYGIIEGDIIGIIAKNSEYLAPVVFGCLVIGAPINTLDPTFDKIEISHMLKITKPKLIFCDYDNYNVVCDSLRNIKLKCTIFIFGNKRIEGIHSVQDLFEAVENEQDFISPKLSDTIHKPAMIICSSGTTGLSKGVCISHAALLERILYVFETQMNDIIFCFSSLYWLSGVCILLTGVLRGSTRIITTERFSPDLLVNIVKKYKVTHLLTPPSQLALTLQCQSLSSENLSSIKYYLCGGSAVSPKLCKEMNKYLLNGQIHIGYGLSELAGVAAITYPKVKENSVGKLTTNVSIKILNDNGKLVGINEQGEIYCLSKYPFIGYYDNTLETNQVIDSEGWIRTGDIGYFDNDGYLYLIDRKKDIIKYFNYQISPSELEDLIIGYGNIKQVCVVGIPDEVATDLPAAVILQTDKIIVTENDIYNYVSEHVSNFKQLRGGVYFVRALPTTPSGKIKRREVKQLAIRLYNERNLNKN